MYALIQNGIVINTIVWDGVTPITFASGVTAQLVPSGTPVTIGDSFDGTSFHAAS